MVARNVPLPYLQKCYQKGIYANVFFRNNAELGYCVWLP